MRDFVICGCFMGEDGVMEEVFCNPHTGDLIRNSDLLGNCIVGNVAVTDPTNMEGVDMTGLLKYCNAIGAVKTDTYLLTFREDMVVEYRKVSNARVVEKTAKYDLDVEYEGSLE